MSKSVNKLLFPKQSVRLKQVEPLGQSGRRNENESLEQSGKSKRKETEPLYQSSKVKKATRK